LIKGLDQSAADEGQWRGFWINLDPSTKRYVKMTAIRRLAAILAAGVAGYSRLMGADKEGTLERVETVARSSRLKKGQLA
jgi:class 3 adenylate cyclase